MPHRFRLKDGTKNDPMDKVVYEKLRDDSLSNLRLVETALGIVTKRTREPFPKLAMMTIMRCDLSTGPKKYMLTDVVDIAVEEMTLLQQALQRIRVKLPRRAASPALRGMRAEEKPHQKLLGETKAREEMEADSRPACLRNKSLSLDVSRNLYSHLG